MCIRDSSVGGGALDLPVEVVGEHESGAHAYKHIERMTTHARLPLRRSPRAPSSLRHGAAPPELAQEVTGVARNSDSGMPSPPTSSVVSGRYCATNRSMPGSSGRLVPLFTSIATVVCPTSTTKSTSRLPPRQ